MTMFLMWIKYRTQAKANPYSQSNKSCLVCMRVIVYNTKSTSTRYEIKKEKREREKARKVTTIKKKKFMCKKTNKKSSQIQKRIVDRKARNERDVKTKFMLSIVSSFVLKGATRF